MVSILHLLLFLHLLFANFSGAAEAFLMFGIKNETHVKKTPKKKKSARRP